MAHSTSMKILGIRTFILLLLVVLFTFAASNYLRTGNSANPTAKAAQTGLAQAYQELIEVSQKEKKGLTFFLGGQTVAGVVVRTIANEAVEVRSQTYSRVIIRLASVDAVAMN